MTGISCQALRKSEFGFFCCGVLENGLAIGVFARKHDKAKNLLSSLRLLWIDTPISTNSLVSILYRAKPIQEIDRRISQKGKGIEDRSVLLQTYLCQTWYRSVAFGRNELIVGAYLHSKHDVVNEHRFPSRKLCLVDWCFGFNFLESDAGVLLAPLGEDVDFDSRNQAVDGWGAWG